MSRGDSSNTTLTFSPYKKAVFSGDQSRIAFDNPGVDIHLGAEFRASLIKRNLGKKYATFETFDAAAIPDKETHYLRTGEMVNKSAYTLQYNASLNEQLYNELEKKKLHSQFYASVSSGTAAVGMAAMMKLQQLSASVPAGNNDSAAGKVGPLTQIPFIQDVLGVPNEQYWINELFHKVALPQLHAEQPEVDWIAPLLNLSPAADTGDIEPDFDSHFFDAVRSEVPFIIPREYRMRSTIDPYNLYADAAARALREGREAKSLLALSALPAKPDIEKPDDPTPTGGFPAAKNNTKVELEALFATHWKDTRLMIDACVVAPQTFAKYESNFFTKGFSPYANIETWGLVNLPGFKRPIRCAISPFMQEGRLYFFNSRYAMTGEGPQVTESWAKPEKNSDAGAWRDYNDIVIFNPKRAGFKLKIKGSNPDPEINTIDEARALVAPPADVLEK